MNHAIIKDITKLRCLFIDDLFPINKSQWRLVEIQVQIHEGFELLHFHGTLSFPIDLVAEFAEFDV